MCMFMYVCACANVSAQVRAFLGGMGRGVEVEVDIPGGWSLIQHASRQGGGGQNIYLLRGCSNVCPL